MQKSCPKCEMTLQDILDSGVVGCSNCYAIFHDELLSTIQNMQKCTNHVADEVERFERGEHG